MAWISILHNIFIILSAVYYYLLLIYCRLRLFLNIDQSVWLEGSGIWVCDPLNIWNQGKMCRSFLITMSSKVETLTIKPNIMITYCLTHCFPTDSKYVTLNDFESWFCVKLCFAPACLELWSVAFEGWWGSFKSIVLLQDQHSSQIRVVNRCDCRKAVVHRFGSGARSWPLVGLDRVGRYGSGWY